MSSPPEDGCSCQTLEAAIAVAQIEIVGIRLDPKFLAVLDSVKALGLGHVQRAQNQRVQQPKTTALAPIASARSKPR